MSENSKIEWTDHTFNPWEGCQKVGPGCDHCYAETRNARFAGGTAINWGPGAPRRRTSAANWRKPLKWEAQNQEFAAQHGRRQRVFCASLADVFDNAVPDEWRTDLFALIEQTPNLDWLILTKRIGNVKKMVPPGWLQPGGWPRHVRLGITVVNQAEADRDTPELLRLSCPNFLSMEPLLEAVDLVRAGALWTDMNGNVVRSVGHHRSGVQWVITGGESGPRPVHPDWLRALRDQCAAAGVPFHFKQWGSHSLAYDRDRDDPDWRQCSRIARKPGRWINIKGGHGFHGDRVHYAERVAKGVAGRLLDGVLHNAFPEPT
ncbi:MAG: hypothetical protein GAK35_01050 [Herbaspirillum frisingense]|uniref:Phage Gp37/Gp68 family protein n=1 Tax=Herbaspirillum frisingense TaxID=92645 RepID=A0A7V8FYU8_9BURK|nr:MAG: hypothetical protein GAK35_01050 [Herbaspirillum frisingense]